MARKKDLWIIDYLDIDPSRNGTEAYENQKEAYAAAKRFIQSRATDELGDAEPPDADGDPSAPEMLNDCLKAIRDGKIEDAIIHWLEYQAEFDPNEQIRIGPSGNVTESSSEFAYLVNHGR